MASIIITGGTGFVGSYLIEEILRKDPAIKKIYVLTRNIAKIRKKFSKHGDLVTGFSDFKDLSKNIKLEYVINLAGEPIADKRWSDKQKTKLRQSRIETTKNLVYFIAKLKVKPKTLISASAVGYYGSNDSKEQLDEDSDANEEFTHFLCKDWENQAKTIEKYGIKVYLTRFGIILGKNGGVLKKMLTPFKLGFGGKIASGEQMMPWIHIKDVARGIIFLLNSDEPSGPFNFCTPSAVSNKKFTKSLAKAVHRPAFFDMPLPIVKLLFGEMGERLLAKGQNVYPQKLLDAGFDFRYKKIDTALKNIV